MTGLYDFDRTFSVVDRVENAAIPLPDAIDIFPEEFLATRGSRLRGEALHSVHHAAQISLRDTTKLQLFEAENVDRKNACRGPCRNDRGADANCQSSGRNPNRIQSIGVKWNVRYGIYLGIQRNQSPPVGAPG